ncbi:pseudouridine synthase [Pleionea sediminis]|uniref:pseudouridine synthase n=1 Tax=Pleionea sediminis TaxID=2569479 RepID=UPI001186EF2B|nr:pseudouridine synthase [Pleionea sediminis]
MNIPVIKETDDWIAANKPAGLSVHDTDGAEGVVSLLKKEFNLDYLALVHRLDKVTSGCLLLAKNKEAAAHLSKQFQLRNVKKIYIAITEGKPKKKQGMIKGDMVSVRNGNFKLTKSMNNPAITQFFSLGYKDGLRLAFINILTGKTHQIRVALKSNGTPVLGDTRYGKQNDSSIDRCYLHHYICRFQTQNGELVTIKASPFEGEKFQEPDFQELLILNESKISGWLNK